VDVVLLSRHTIGVARGELGAMVPPKFLEHIVILCFEKRYPKQNSVIRLKWNILAPLKIFVLATLLRHTTLNVIVEIDTSCNAAFMRSYYNT